MKLSFIERHYRQIMAALAFILAAGVGWVDYFTGYDYSVSILYLIPVFVAAWFVGKRTAVATAVACAAAWLIAELMAKRYSEVPFALYWNDFMELGFFLVVAYALSTLKSLLDHEKRSARTDPLTGIANRRHFYDCAEIEMNRLKRYGRVFSVAYMDIDNFKTVNDTFGHGTGDDLLRLTAEVIKKTIRASDVAARLGGDEFGLLLPETGKEAAVSALKKIQEAFTEVVSRNKWPVSLSIGVITYISLPESVDAMIGQVDTLMYQAKHEGKDKIKHVAVGLKEQAIA